MFHAKGGMWMVTTGVCCDSHKGGSSGIFPVCQGSRPDPAWKLMCPSVLTLLVWPCCHGPCEALDCALSTLSLPEASPAQLQDQALALDPRSKCSGGSTVRMRWLKWHPPPSPGLSVDEQGSYKDPVPLLLLPPSVNSNLLHPCCPWGLQSPAAQPFLSPLYCQTQRSPYPCVALQSGLKRVLCSKNASNLTPPQLLNFLWLHSTHAGWAG